MSIARLAERFREEYEDLPYQRIHIAHADCLAEAEELKSAISAIVPDKAKDIRIGYVGPIVGASAGPGTLAVYFYGKEVTFDASKK